MTGGVNSRYAWPDEGVTRVPNFVYEDAELYEAEQTTSVFRQVLVTPAKAGVQGNHSALPAWIPAFAGTTSTSGNSLRSRLILVSQSEPPLLAHARELVR